MQRRRFIKKSIIMATSILAADMLHAACTINGKSGRSVYRIVNPNSTSMGALTIKSIFQGDYQNYVSPFFVFDEFGPIKLNPGTPFRVEAHPHAGIIPTTYLLEGNAHHRDSMDNDFQYHQGDFIQFTSGKGALHMEETGDGLFENGGIFHGIQAWLNIPPKLKKSEPYASHLKDKNIEVVELGTTEIKVILGEVFGIKSKTNLLMPVLYWHISMKENTTLNLPVDPSLNAFVYVLNGQLEINNNQIVNKGQTVLFERDSSTIVLKAEKDTAFLVLGGEVNNEPYTANGPFVLNNQEEIRQAYLDYQTGKFGDINKTNGVKRK